MKKIPTLFEREFKNHNVVKIYDRVERGMEWVLNGDGVATIKWDGSCCAVLNGELYKRFDAKPGRTAPDGAIPCCPPDPITGHWPHWVRVDEFNPADKWFVHAAENYQIMNNIALNDGTYEAIGVHFNGNHHNLLTDILRPHGIDVVEVPRTFDGIRDYLRDNKIEGLVFWLNGEPMCKIKRSDFGYDWGRKNGGS